MHCRREYAAAPWALIEGNDKYWARTKVLAKLVKILSSEMGLRAGRSSA
jgi:polyphosphate kinase 2 (PPK2 family)